MTRNPVSLSDEGIRAAVLAAFTRESRLTGCELHIGVLNGITHLAGWVDSLDQRTAAEATARVVPGVRDVVNRIEAPGAPNPGRIINLDLDPGSSK